MPIIYNRNNIALWSIKEALAWSIDNTYGCFAPSSSLSIVERNHLVANRMSHEFYQSDISHRNDGSPFLVSSSIHISISHTNNIVALYGCSTPCGIDIESVTRDAKKVARKFIAEGELELATLLYPTNPHLLIWCAKEVLYKITRIEGASFLSDLTIKGIKGGGLVCQSFEREYTIIFFEYNNLLIVHND